jgi:hypothetical protein
MNLNYSGTTHTLATRNGFASTAATGFPSYFGLDPHAPMPNWPNVVPVPSSQRSVDRWFNQFGTRFDF